MENLAVMSLWRFNVWIKVGEAEVCLADIVFFWIRDNYLFVSVALMLSFRR